MMGTGAIGIPPSAAVWTLILLVILSGIAALIAMTRAGIRTFWSSLEGTVPRVLVIEIFPVMGLLALTLALTIWAGPVMQYMDATIRTLSDPNLYVDAVRNAVVAPAKAGGL